MSYYTEKGDEELKTAQQYDNQIKSLFEDRIKKQRFGVFVNAFEAKSS